MVQRLPIKESRPLTNGIGRHHDYYRDVAQSEKFLLLSLGLNLCTGSVVSIHIGTLNSRAVLDGLIHDNNHEIV